jgi:predicted AAA+ superfamily ATPase
MGRRKRERQRRSERILELAQLALERFVGEPPDADAFERHLAFRYEPAPSAGGRGRLVPVAEPSLFDLDDLVGVDASVASLVRNTEQFVRGLPANHVLLYGERGTGKSSAVKGLATRFGSRGLRLVEVHKADLLHLPDVLAALRDAPWRFLLFCDDLSFEAGEASYRELKAALEGSVESPPANVRIVATSNRRHLIPERRADSDDAHVDDRGELHMGEAVEEKLALSDRFGLQLAFFGFDQDTYLAIVDRYVAKAGLDLPREQVQGEALRWALRRSSRSGRTARQFVDDLAGRVALARDGDDGGASR